MAQPVELRDGKVLATEMEMERLALCEEQGGCHIVTVAQVQAVVQALVIKAIRDNQMSCMKDL